MIRRLNTPRVQQAMESRGLSQTNIASTLKVSREAVSQWLNEKVFPRPDKLLRLSKLLELPFHELVIKEEEHVPVVAFRKYKGTKIGVDEQEHARTMGRALRNLVPYVPFDIAVLPPRLKEPKPSYEYVQQAAERVRREINLEPGAHLEVRDLVGHFKTLQAVLIPVLWGDLPGADRHANATHVFLPDSGTMWIYLNLDTHLLDFKFWMAHELGHCLAPGESQELEDFAEAFAGALLFSEGSAEKLYQEIHSKTASQQLAAVRAAALDRRIAPYTVSKQLEKYAIHSDLAPIQLGKKVHPLSAVLNKKFPHMGAHLFGSEGDISTDLYIQRASEFFDTPFFEMLSKYLRVGKQGPGVVQTIMDIPLLDARSLYDKLT